MDFSEIEKYTLSRIKVRALVKCGDDYVFIQRRKYGKSTTFLCFPGGRVKKSDRAKDDKRNLIRTLKQTLIRELEEELAAKNIRIGECLGITKPRNYDIEVLYRVEIGSFDWESRTGKEFLNPDKGTYECVLVQELTKKVLGKRGYHLKPKEWRKLMYSLGT